METFLILTTEQANIIKGKHGIYSEIEPILLPDGNYMIPEDCIFDPDLISVKDTLVTMDASIKNIEKLPDIGQQVYAGKYYSYYPPDLNLETFFSDIVIAVQDHIRMDYPPEQTPALFTFFRVNADDLVWIPNEKVYLGWKRVYEEKTYEVIQEHMTQTDWTPTTTLNVLWKLVQEDEEIPIWVQPTGAHDAYNIGDKVIFENVVWESLINANVWSPSIYPAGWNKLYDL